LDMHSPKLDLYTSLEWQVNRLVISYLI
jgi:hypothetical protein